MGEADQTEVLINRATTSQGNCVNTSKMSEFMFPGDGSTVRRLWQRETFWGVGGKPQSAKFPLTAYCAPSTRSLVESAYSPPKCLLFKFLSTNVLIGHTKRGWVGWDWDYALAYDFWNSSCALGMTVTLHSENTAMI